LKEKIKEDKASKNMDRGQFSKRKKTPTWILWSTSRKEGRTVGEALKTWVM
jgi:hypothetical protein